MQQFCTYGSVRGASGQPASLPRRKDEECFERLRVTENYQRYQCPFFVLDGLKGF
jgi:hypothetical protein